MKLSNTLTPALVGGPDLSLSRLSARSNQFAYEIRAEKKIQHEIILNALSRAKEFFSSIGKSDDSPFDQKSVQVARRIFDAGSNTATSIVANLSPFSTLLNLKSLRDSATKLSLLSKHPQEARDARAEMILALAETGVGVGAIAAPLVFGAAGTVLLAARVASCIHDLCRLKRDKETQPGILKKAALALVTNPAVALCMDKLAVIISKIDDQAQNSYSELKLAMKNGQCSAEMHSVLHQFYCAYERAYPESQRERKENMIKYLANDPEWDLHTIRENGVVVGGFTTFLVDHPKYGKQLMLEQMFPPRSEDPKLHEQVWVQIKQYAAEMNCRGIWHEVGLAEPAPPGFKIVDAFHAQPALNAVGSEGQREGDRGLRMSAYFPDNPGANGVDAAMYRAIVLHGWIKTWAHNADPILKDLTRELAKEQGSFALAA